MQVSVIVPIYNIESYLQETLQSIEAQKGVSFEVLMIDDGSTDSSGEIAGRFAQKDRRFRYLPRKNQGVSAARNAGIALARGEYIVFCDGDDLLPAGSLKALYSRAVKENADLVIGRMYEVGTGEVILYRATDRLGKKPVISGADRDLLWTFMISGKMYRRKFLQEHEITFPPLRYSEDAVFFMHCVYRADIICGCNHPAYYYRKRSADQESSVTQRCSRELWQDFIQAHQQVEKLYRCYLKEKLSDKQQKIYENAIYQKTAESILGAFYRQYWNCDSELSHDIFDTAAGYLGKMSRKSREMLLEKNSDLLSDKRELRRSFETEPLLTIYISEKLIDDEENTAAEKLPLILKSVYSQKFVAFQIVAADCLADYVPENYKCMPNFRFADSQSRISTEYILVIDKPVFFSPNALLHGWAALRKKTGVQGVASCNPGKRYNKLPLKICADPCYNFCVRIWCSLQAKLPALFVGKAVRFCRINGQGNYAQDHCIQGDCVQRDCGKKCCTGKSGMAGSSGFRVLYF